MALVEFPGKNEEMKVCFVCKKEKPKKEFGKWKKSKDGFDYRCKICKRKFTNNWNKNKKKLVEENKANLPDPSQVLKFCIKCKLTKPLTKFRKNKTSWDGTLNICQKCDNKSNSVYQKKRVIALEEERSLLPDQSDQLKVCLQCRETKPKKDFHKSKKSKDGYDYMCKKCANEYKLNWQKNLLKLAAEQRAILPDQSEVPKVCSQCGKTKLTKEFASDKRTLDGKAGYCQDCSNKYHVGWFAILAHKEKRQKRINEKYYLDEDKQGKTHIREGLVARNKKVPISSRAKAMRRTMIYNADKEGFDFDSSYFTPEKVEEMIETNDICSCCDRIFDKSFHGDGKIREAVPCPDRVDPNLGYVKENVVMICRRCNWIKNDGTADEFLRIVQWMLEFKQKRGLR